tara:strand:+ start:1271 stop:1480 length:210 start_codon:yes stop_codon:yes gene_type:complete
LTNKTEVEMSKNLWQRERSDIFRDLVKEYSNEGYDIKEARRLARIETNEIMQDKESFVNEVWEQSFHDR